MRINGNYAAARCPTIGGDAGRHRSAGRASAARAAAPLRWSRRAARRILHRIRPMEVRVTSDHLHPAVGERVEAAPIDASWQSWCDQQRRRIDDALSRHVETLKATQRANQRLIDAVAYALLGGGKRLRPMLVLESCRVCGGDERDALPAAIAVECVHSFTLIHDDLPAMDDDDLRHGRPTVHKAFDEATAILAGDWLLAHAVRLLAGERDEQRAGGSGGLSGLRGAGRPEAAAAMARVLAEAVCDVIIGQSRDIEGERIEPSGDAVEFIHLHKTARLFEACCELGALAASTSEQHRARIRDFGLRLGLAFQIVDDLLDRDGSAAAAGKRVGKDQPRGKQTYPAAFGVDQSRRRLQQEVDQAIACLSEFGAAADKLRGLARFVASRDR
jgi:geranylgeranyl pyrophosphate synthase